MMKELILQVLEKVINFAEKKGSFKELDGAMNLLKLKSLGRCRKNQYVVIK